MLRRVGSAYQLISVTISQPSPPIVERRYHQTLESRGSKAALFWQSRFHNSFSTISKRGEQVHALKPQRSSRAVVEGEICGDPPSKARLLLMKRLLLTPRLTEKTALENIRNSSDLSEQFSTHTNARKMAETMARTSTPRLSYCVLDLAHKAGCKLPQSAYECVAYQLAERRKWNLIPSLVSLGKRHTGRTTSRLLNWRTRAYVETSQFGLLESALGVFELEGLQPTQRTFHLLISGSIRNHNLSRAKEYLNKMVEAGYPVTPATHALVLSAYRSLGPDAKVQSHALEALRQSGTQTSRVILNSLIQLRIDAQDLQGALQIITMFDQTTIKPSPGAIPTNTPHPRKGGETASKEKPLDFPDKTRNRHPPDVVLPDATTFTIFLRYMARSGDLNNALHMFQMMTAVGITPNAGALAALVSTCFKAGYDTAAVRFVSEMGFGKVPRNLFTSLSSPFNSDQPVPRVPSGAQLSIEVLNALFKGILDTSGLEGACRVLRIMRASEVRPDADTIRILLSHLDRVHHLSARELLRTLKLMTSRSTPPNLRQLHLFLKSVLRREKYKGERGWKEIARKAYTRQNGDTQEQVPSTPAASFDPTAGIGIPRSAPYYTGARSLVQSLSSRGIKSDRLTVGLRLRHEAIHKLHMEDAKNVYEEMLSRGMYPNEYHFTALMEGYVKNEDMETAEALMDSAARAGIKLNVVMFTILIVGHSKRGNPDLAMRTFQRMVATGVKPDVPAIDAVVSAYFAVGAYGTARRVLIQLWPHIAPFPEDLSEEPLKILARQFRSLHRGSRAQTSRPTKEQRILLYKKLKYLLKVWGSLRYRFDPQPAVPSTATPRRQFLPRRRLLGLSAR